MQISYSSCWNIIRTLESQLSYSLIDRSQGGAGGSTSDLTQRGRELLERYNAYEKQLKDQANALYGQYFGGLFE
jgi:molybdate transport repressor ModE-like protein